MEYNTILTTSSTEIISKTFITTLFLECSQMVFELRWMILLGGVLILCDLWFGISASRVLGVDVRKSRAGRRTLNKMIDYLCYIVMGTVLGKAIGDPYGFDPIIIAVSIMILCYCFEIDSIYGHICTIHGLTKQYSIWKLLWLLISFKFKDLGSAFTYMKEQIKNRKNQQDTL